MLIRSRLGLLSNITSVISIQITAFALRYKQFTWQPFGKTFEKFGQQFPDVKA